MSYASPQAPQGRDGIKVGSKAGGDIILAQASYDASQILLRAARRPRSQRLAYVRSAMRRYGPGAAALFTRERETLRGRGWSPNQATYDAMRLVASNAYALEGMQAIRAALATEVSGEYAEGLGTISDEGRAIGCGITGGVTAIGGLIASIYGGQAGGTAVGAGGGMVGGALDCGKEARQSQERIAAAQAEAAQATANAALAAAQAQERTQTRLAEEQTKQITTVAIVGGGLLLLLATGYAIIKV